MCLSISGVEAFFYYKHLNTTVNQWVGSFFLLQTLKYNSQSSLVYKQIPVLAGCFFCSFTQKGWIKKKNVHSLLGCGMEAYFDYFTHAIKESISHKSRKNVGPFTWGKKAWYTSSPSRTVRHGGNGKPLTVQQYIGLKYHKMQFIFLFYLCNYDKPAKV